MPRLLLAAAVLVTASAAPTQPPAPAADKATAQFSARLRDKWWREFDTRRPRGKQLLEHGIDWTFFWPGKGDPPNRSYLTDNDNESQQVVGEVFVDATKNPVWLDFRYYDAGARKYYVHVGIARFDGEKLHWVRQLQVEASAWERARHDVPTRPTRFTDKDGQPVGYVLEPYEVKK